MAKMRTVFVAMLCAAAVLGAALAGCAQEAAPTGPTVEELTQISPAVGYLAARAEHWEGFICVEDSPNGGNSFAYLYDNAAAVIALARAGATRHAQWIADAMVYAMQHDRYFDDGRLRNAYVGGNPRGERGWFFAGGAAAARLPGFWSGGQWQEDYYSVSTSTGNMAWAILALCEAARIAPEGKAAEYTAAALRAADFVLTLQSNSGGFTGGYEGWDESQTKAAYKSTEHNIDVAAAFASLAALVQADEPARAAAYTGGAQHATDFVLSMYDEKLHCFYTGTEDDGKTISKGVLPLDTNTWALLVLGSGFAEYEDVFRFVEKNIAVGPGFDFSAGDLDGIWHEGTAQMAVCYKVFGRQEAYDEVMDYLNGQMAADGSITAADRDGVSTGFMVSGTDVPWVYNKTTNLGATNWLAFAQMGINPMQPA